METTVKLSLKNGSNAPSTKGYCYKQVKKYNNNFFQGVIDFIFAVSDNLVYTESDNHFELVLNSVDCGIVTVTKVTATTEKGTGESDICGSSANKNSQNKNELTIVDLGGKCPALTTES